MQAWATLENCSNRMPPLDFRSTPRTAEPVLPGARTRGHLHARQVDHILGPDHRIARQKIRARDGDDILMHQELAIGARPIRLADMDGGVDLLGFEIETADAGGEIDDDLGIFRHEIGNARISQRVPKVAGWRG